MERTSRQVYGRRLSTKKYKLFELMLGHLANYYYYYYYCIKFFWNKRAFENKFQQMCCSYIILTNNWKEIDIVDCVVSTVRRPAINLIKELG